MCAYRWGQRHRGTGPGSACTSTHRCIDNSRVSRGHADRHDRPARQQRTTVGAKAGTFLTVWITGALAKSHGPHADVQGWYAWILANIVLPHAAFWSVAVTCGECLIGIGLILGMFTGIAAFFGTILNESYLLSGTVSINPILLPLGTFLVLAWKTAGWWGLDRWLLPSLGTPWRSSHAATEVIATPTG